MPEGSRAPGWLSQRIVIVVSTFGGIGLIPKASGTMASAIVALAGFAVAPALPAMVVGFGVLGLLCARSARVIFSRQDPPMFVMDEAAGMALSLVALPHDPRWFFAAFVLFRLFDIWKPGWIRTLDRLPGPSAIMLDDFAAALAAQILLQTALRVPFFS